jgi:hypothetical protein
VKRDQTIETTATFEFLCVNFLFGGLLLLFGGVVCFDSPFSNTTATITTTATSTISAPTAKGNNNNNTYYVNTLGKTKISLPILERR